MKTFAEIREATKPSAKVVFDKKILGVAVQIVSAMNKFTVIVDGDELDSYDSQAQAEKMAKSFVKQLKA
jgi:hypothetical protein